jgi:protein-S-isoprenylcysteine O-methyltransferase Ste14
VFFSGPSLGFLISGYVIVASFLVIERMLRRTSSAKALQRGNYDKGSTMLIGAAFGLGLILPLVLDILGIGIFFSINLIEGALALTVMLIGMGLRVWAARTLGKYYTRTLLTTEEQKVISVGPYARIRHPGYLGDILLWSGFGVLSSNLVIAILFPIMFVAAYLYRIRVEEKMLAASLGEQYARYRKRTFRLVPFVY